MSSFFSGEVACHNRFALCALAPFCNGREVPRPPPDPAHTLRDFGCLPGRHTLYNPPLTAMTLERQNKGNSDVSHRFKQAISGFCGGLPLTKRSRERIEQAAEAFRICDVESFGAAA